MAATTTVAVAGIVTFSLGGIHRHRMHYVQAHLPTTSHPTTATVIILSGWMVGGRYELGSRDFFFVWLRCGVHNLSLQVILAILGKYTEDDTPS